MMLKNGQTYFENLTLLTPQDFYKVCFAIFQYIYEKVNLEHIHFVFSAKNVINTCHLSLLLNLSPLSIFFWHVIVTFKLFISVFC